MLKDSGESQLRGNHKSEAQAASDQRADRRADVREAAKHVPGSPIDDHSHDRHLHKFRPSFTDARDQQGNPDQTEQEPGAENDGAIRETGLNDLWHTRPGL
ncbi:hypothetical protein [Synechococcus sp. CBW1107]|uniref:hypothetical protein n=1 Tax=Synechococcus sp. CBW1107 TaxID=2789857 RepID=UPI001E2C5080|nr:hypothetical protein [Synechococcus sp. CBW1107]